MPDELPNVELLESVHSFPCVFRFKVIGEASDNFAERVLAAVRAELKEEIELSFTTRTTSGGRHVSVTVEPEMQNADHVIAVYARLRVLEGLVMLM